MSREEFLGLWQTHLPQIIAEVAKRKLSVPDPNTYEPRRWIRSR